MDENKRPKTLQQVPSGGRMVFYHHVRDDGSGWMLVAHISRVGTSREGTPGDNPEQRCTLHVLDPDNDEKPVFLARDIPFGPNREPGSWWWPPHIVQVEAPK